MTELAGSNWRWTPSKTGRAAAIALTINKKGQNDV